MPGPEPASDDLPLLLEAARGAGEIAARRFRHGLKIWDKGAGLGPVTEADLEVNDFLRGTLEGARPGYGWLSEESNPLGDLSRLEAERVFVIDPIDGTRAFIEGQEGFAHALAVLHAGVPVAAVVHLPMLGLTYAARAGQGATLNGVPIAVRPRSEADGAQVLAARPVFDPTRWPGGMPALERHFRASLAWRLALVAEGRFDAALSLRDAWDWDIAGATLIAREAGARVTDRSGAPLRFNRPEARNDGLIAAAPALQQALLARLSPEAETGAAPGGGS